MIDRQLNNEAIFEHNRLRTLHGSPPLAFDQNLAAESQKWAERLAATHKLEHSKAEGYGENLAYTMNTSGAKLSGAEATKMWYDEIEDHNFNGEFNSKTGHFTQVVWKSTLLAGFGACKTSDGKSIYVVGRYKPAGNVMGLFATNVNRPKTSQKQRTEIPVVNNHRPKISQNEIEVQPRHKRKLGIKKHHKKCSIM